MSNLDNPFSSLLNIMREEGKYNNSSPFLFGKYKGNNQVETNGITLYADDLLINQGLTLVAGDSVLLATVTEKFIILCKVVSL